MFYKAIIQGRLEFGNDKSYQKVVKMYDYRTENYYKGVLVFTAEEVFNNEDLSLEIPRHVSQITEKNFKNTCSLLEYCAQFALAGSIRAWQIDEGKIMHYAIIEPDSDKVAVRSFLKGRKLVKQIGKEDEAIKALTKAIEKYDRHAQAYERRAKVNFLLKKYHDAKRDYTKCINIDSTIPTAYYGRAKVHILEKNYQEAIDDLEESTRYSIALQAVYWKAKRIKAECHIKLKQWEKAAFDLKFFSKRIFKTDDPNYPWGRWGYYYYGYVLLELKEYKEALAAFNIALETDMGAGKIENRDILRLRGVAKKYAGKTGYLKDIREAAKLGDLQAKSLLKEFA
jgi:tetratricopeptide (TPR) repeat protein